MRTFIPKRDDMARQWYVIDAQNVSLGKVATTASKLLQGKHKPIYTPNEDCGDFVIVINAKKVYLSGNKKTHKRLYHHSGFPGGMRSDTYGELLERNPERIIKQAVRGMVPKTTLGRQQLKKLRVFAGETHPHEAQQPKPYAIGKIDQ